MTQKVLKQAFRNSCNCAFAQIAEQLGKTNMVNAVKKYEITERLTFDGITTAKGNYDVTDTAPVTFAWSCIGQYTDLINPCRFMTFMGAIAGNGTADDHEIICQCESVTKGQILTAIARGAKTVEAVKRRGGTGMGVCQGSRCGWRIAKILKETGMDPDPVF